MKELVEVIAKSLVENPDEVVVTETEKARYMDAGAVETQLLFLLMKVLDGRHIRFLQRSFEWKIY